MRLVATTDPTRVGLIGAAGTVMQVLPNNEVVLAGVSFTDHPGRWTMLRGVDVLELIAGRGSEVAFLGRR